VRALGGGLVSSTPECQLQARPVHSRGRGHAPLASRGHTTAPQDQV